MGVAQGVDSFDGRNISETPVRDSVPKGANATQAAVSSAVGAPPVAKFDSAAATGAVTLQAGDSRPTTSSLRATGAAVDSFGGGTV